MVKNLETYRFVVTSKRARFMVDGEKYNLSDFEIIDKEMPNGNILPALQHVSGFWFGLENFCNCFDTDEDAMRALENGKTITRYHKIIYGKQIKTYVVEF